MVSDARYPELGPARVRQPRRLLAHAGRHRRTGDRRDAGHQWLGHPAYEPIARAAKARNWEFIGHGFGQRNMQKVPDETIDIAKTTSDPCLYRQAPARLAWPGTHGNRHTPDIPAEQGYEYVCDWVLDDQPVELKTRDGGRIVNVPYTQECNDVAMMLIQHHKASEYRDRAIDQFEQLYADAKHSARVMALVVHPYIMGAPHRLRYFREALAHIRARDDVAFLTGEQILDWYKAARIDR